MKKQDVMEEDWDYLIILDACRYDYFEKVYTQYVEGDLEKRNSDAGATQEWLYNTFPNDYDYFDISYFSANPWINSKGFSLKDMDASYDWCASHTFNHIVDLWEHYWDEDIGTVKPNKVVEGFHKAPKMKRSIIHFVQPHLPFIHPESKFKMIWGGKKKIENERKYKDEKQVSILKRIRNYLFYDINRKIFRDKLLEWRIRKIFDVPPLNRYEEIYQLGQLDRVPEFYEHSIKESLNAVLEIIDSAEGKIVITADHGECFGEYNTWGHENENHNPILTTVPWCELEV
ncbi:MAG: hypothetical protein ACOC5T_08510 [Elusimicrobiota bacterium]